LVTEIQLSERRETSEMRDAIFAVNSETGAAVLAAED
jgi:hypothetical protein